MINNDLLIELYNDGYNLKDIRTEMGVHYNHIRNRVTELIDAGKIEVRVWGRNSVTGKRRCRCGILMERNEKRCEFCIGDKEDEELPAGVLNKSSKELASAVLRNAVTDARVEQQTYDTAIEEIRKMLATAVANARENWEANAWLYSGGAQFNYDILEFDHGYITNLLEDNGITKEPVAMVLSIKTSSP